MGFLWGATIAASIASAVNDRADAAATTMFGPSVARRVVPTSIGPAVEELAKASGLVVVAVVSRHALATARGGAAAGAVLGLGFAAAENVTYYLLATVQGGYAGMLRAVYLRGIVEGFNHALFTAITGAALGMVVARGWRWPTAITTVGAGLLAAIGAHGLWNAVASVAITRVLCNAPTPDGACAASPDGVDLFLTVPAVVVATIGPIALLLAVGLRRRDSS